MKRQRPWIDRVFCFMKKNFLLTAELTTVIKAMTDEQAGVLLKTILIEFDNVEISNVKPCKTQGFQLFKEKYLNNNKLNKKDTAESLGVSRQTIYDWIKQINL